MIACAREIHLEGAHAAGQERQLALVVGLQQLGQRLDQLAAPSLVLADVAHDGGHADDAALLACTGGCGQGNVYRRAVLANAEALVADVLAGTHAAVDVLELGLGVRGIEYAHRAADGLVPGVAEHALRRRVPRQDGAVGRQADDGVVGRRGNGRQSGVGLLGLLALCDVEGDAEKRNARQPSGPRRT